MITKIVAAAGNFMPNAICSPAPLPKVYTPTYYNQLVRLGAELSGQLKKPGHISTLAAAGQLAAGD